MRVSKWRRSGVQAAAGAVLLMLSATVPARIAMADDLVREDAPCNLLCRIFVRRPEPAVAAVTPGPDLGAGTLDDPPERPPPQRRVRPKRIAAKPAGESLAIGPSPVPPSAAPAPVVARSPAEVKRAAPPSTTGDKLSQEEHRKAAMAAEDAISTRLNARARRALDSMCVGCLGRPAAVAIPAGRQVEPMTGEATRQRAP